jgi:hypothetical protein
MAHTSDQSDILNDLTLWGFLALVRVLVWRLAFGVWRLAFGGGKPVYRMFGHGSECCGV